MIVDNGKYFLYRHVRLDKNEPFYIGIGSTKSYPGKTRYYRMYIDKGRNKYWTHIAKKTEYLCEVLLETDDIDFLYEKEREFINLYGRWDLGKGPLVNMTDGGEGGLNLSPEVKASLSSKLRAYYTGRPGPNKGKTGANNWMSRKIYCYNNYGYYMRMFISIKEAADFFECSTTSIVVAARDGMTSSNKRFFYEDKGLRIEPFVSNKRIEKPIFLTDMSTGWTIKYPSAKFLVDKFKVGTDCLTNLAKKDKV
jgi:hypothetical protein